MTEKFIMIAGKLSANRYLGAIRDAFIFSVPLTITAAFAVLFQFVVFGTNLPFALANPEYYGEAIIAITSKIKYIFTAIEFGGLQFITLIIVLGLAYVLSDESKVGNSMMNAMIVGGAFLALLPTTTAWVPGGATSATEVLTTANIPFVGLGALFSGTNLFTSLVVGILFTELLIWLQSIKQLNITLPDQVPPAVAKSFSALIPAIIVFLVAGLTAFFFYEVQPLGYSDVSAFVSGVFQQPFLAIAKSGAGGAILAFIYVFFANLLWVFGLHGPNILSGFATPTLGTLALENQTLYAQTGDAFSNELSVFNQQFITIYAVNGGSGATAGLLIAIFLFSKREDYRVIAKLSVMPSLFQINEPVVFGMPIVLNPILAIPFVLAPVVSLILPGILTTIGILPKAVIAIPWVTPPIINAFLATGANWLAAVVCAINIVFTVIIYAPFVIMANKQAEKEAAENAAANTTAT